MQAPGDVETLAPQPRGTQVTQHGAPGSLTDRVTNPRH